MRVVVPVKHVADVNVKVHVLSDESGVDLSNVRMSMNPFDEIAVEEAVRMKEGGVAEEVIAVCIGPEKARDTLRQALAMGMDRAIHVRIDTPVEPLTVAKILCEVAKEEDPKMFILGKQGVDSDYNQTGQMLAGLLGWSQGTFASDVIIENETVRITREVDGGLQTIDICLPAIVTTDLRLNEPRYASLPNIMKAKKKPICEKTPDDYGVSTKLRHRVLKAIKTPQRKRGEIVDSVAELINKLKFEAKVI